MVLAGKKHPIPSLPKNDYCSPLEQGKIELLSHWTMEGWDEQNRQQVQQDTFKATSTLKVVQLTTNEPSLQFKMPPNLITLCHQCNTAGRTACTTKHNTNANHLSLMSFFCLVSTLGCLFCLSSSTCNMLARQQVMASFVINRLSMNAVVKSQFDIVTLISARSHSVIFNALIRPVQGAPKSA